MAKDALGNDVKATSWLATHAIGDRSLTQGLKVRGQAAGGAELFGAYCAADALQRCGKVYGPGVQWSRPQMAARHWSDSWGRLAASTGSSSVMEAAGAGRDWNLTTSLSSRRIAGAGVSMARLA